MSNELIVTHIWYKYEVFMAFGLVLIWFGLKPKLPTLKNPPQVQTKNKLIFLKKIK